MSLIYLDIDYFKTINDQYGHHEGDIVLKEIGTRLIKNTRSSDYIGRIGGEEFAVLLPNCSVEKTWQIAERLRKKWRISQFIYKTEHRFTLRCQLDVLMMQEQVKTSNNYRLLQTRSSIKRSSQAETK